MPAPLLWTEDNTSPDIEIQLKRGADAIPLNDASKVEIIIVNDLTAEVTNAGHQQATITAPASNGIVTYTPQANDFPSAGRFRGDAKVTYTTPGKYEILFDQLVVIVRAKNS